MRATTGRQLAAAALVVGAALAGGCSSSSDAAKPSGCSWPATSDPTAAGLAVLTVAERGGHYLEAFDARTGRTVGRCAIGALPGGPARLTVAGQPFGVHGYVPTVPPVAGPRVQLVPDNLGRGGVRDLHTGRRTELRFAGWQVASAAGSRLLLMRGDGSAAGDWCVLPDVTAPQSRCAPVPDAQGSGTATFNAAGQPVWVPAAGRPLRVGAVSGWAATDRRTVVFAYGTGTPTATHSPVESPVAVDDRTIVFSPNAQQATPSGRQTLQWARVEFADGVPRGTVHDSGLSAARLADASTGTPLADPTVVRGIGASADGRSLVLLEPDGVVYAITDTGQVRRLVTLAHPASRGWLPTLVSWPSAAADG